jgi:hypothetical protein
MEALDEQLIVSGRTCHQQGFTKRSTALPQNFIGIERNDIAEREYEGMHVFHVEVVRGDRIGHGVLGED